MGLGSSQDIHLQLIVKLYQYLIGLSINIIISIGHEVTNGHKATDCHVTQNMAVTWQGKYTS